MLFTAVQPTPFMVALTELLRKVPAACSTCSEFSAVPMLCPSSLAQGVAALYGRLTTTLSHEAQVSTYTLTKPARELLFTTTSSKEKFAAKLCIETLILRLGDGLAAALFQALHSMGTAGGHKSCCNCAGAAHCLMLT